MCGIFGCLLKEDGDVSNIVVKGLQKLLYRGYDSWGFVLDNATVKRCLNTPENMYILTDYKGRLGVGHTRWATHGPPSIKNTHPIQSNDGKWFVVHNGVLQNHENLQTEYGLTHSSDTDSEIFVTLAEKIYCQNKLLSFIEVAQQVVSLVEGSYAILMTCSLFPNEMIAACNGSPLLIATSQEGIFVASDHEALKEHSHKFINLDKSEFVHINSKNYTLDSTFMKNKEIRYIHDVSYDPKLGYKHYMLKEIMEQPKSLRALMNGRVYDGSVRLGGLGPYREELLAASEWTFIACGSSYNACIVARPFIEEHFSRKKVIHCEQAADFVNRQAAVKSKGIYILVSQSGETADCISAAEYIRLYDGRCFGINNRPGSILDHHTIAGIHMNIGPEISVAATKSFTASIVSIFMICNMILYKDSNRLLELPDIIESHLNRIINDKIFNDLSKNMQGGTWWSVGDGYGYGIAREVSLKFQEVCYMPFLTNMGYEVKHGPLALVDENIKFFYFGKKRDSVKFLETRGAKEIRLPTVNNAGILPELLCIIISSQLLTYMCAELKGLPIDRPRNLAKSVTV
jgi:glucosamine--fructose-6-phosphate aminotransferase (isomerizing)